MMSNSCCENHTKLHQKWKYHWRIKLKVIKKNNNFCLQETLSHFNRRITSNPMQLLRNFEKNLWWNFNFFLYITESYRRTAVSVDVDLFFINSTNIPPKLKKRMKWLKQLKRKNKNVTFILRCKKIISSLSLLFLETFMYMRIKK